MRKFFILIYCFFALPHFIVSAQTGTIQAGEILTFDSLDVSQSAGGILQESSRCQLPACVRVNGGKFHVQGLAYDSKEGCMYFSFTSAFFKTDMKGNVIASIADINGHIGAMTFDSTSRTVIASLEIKDDAIGRNIAQKLGQEAWSREQSGFYLAVIDVDRLTRMNMKQEEVMTLVRLEEVCDDYKAVVNFNGNKSEHRFACSGIDGVTIGPAFGVLRNNMNNAFKHGSGIMNGSSIEIAQKKVEGNNSGKQRYVYVAYGIYGDTTRTDNDYNIILAYRLEDVLAHTQDSLKRDAGDSTNSAANATCSNLGNDKNANRAAVCSQCAYMGRQIEHIHKYFVHTGNTQWGVQNLAYDSSSNQMFLAVYKGSKRQWPNYSLFALELDQLPVHATLEGVPYHTSPVEQLEVSAAWHFKWGSTGLCPLGDGLFYISHNGASSGNNYCEARLYRWQGSSSAEVPPFVPAADTPTGAK